MGFCVFYSGIIYKIYKRTVTQDKIGVNNGLYGCAFISIGFAKGYKRFEPEFIFQFNFSKRYCKKIIGFACNSRISHANCSKWKLKTMMVRCSSKSYLLPFCKLDVACTVVCENLLVACNPDLLLRHRWENAQIAHCLSNHTNLRPV